MSVDLITDQPMETLPRGQGFAIVAGLAVVAAPPTLHYFLAGAYLLVIARLGWDRLLRG